MPNEWNLEGYNRLSSFRGQCCRDFEIGDETLVAGIADGDLQVTVFVCRRVLFKFACSLSMYMPSARSWAYATI